MLHSSTDSSQSDPQMMRQKRKPDDPGSEADNLEHHSTSLHLYHLTLSKLLSSPTRRIGELANLNISTCTLPLKLQNVQLTIFMMNFEEKLLLSDLLCVMTFMTNVLDLLIKADAN